MKAVAPRRRLAAAVLCCAGLLGATSLASTPVAAQTAVQPPHCAITAQSTGSSAGGGNASFVCIGDLNGDGSPNLFVGTTVANNNGYVLYLNGNGAIVKKVCWGAPTVCPP